MLNPNDPALIWRSLLTDTLPYEVPLIFSNEILYAALARESPNAAVRKVVDCFRAKLNKYTVPYEYKIRKEEDQFTTLGIIHPNQQLEIAKFYEVYKESLLSYCSSGEVSLRRPLAEMPIFSGSSFSEDDAIKQGIPHIIPEDGELDVSRMTSYFTYGRYTLLSKFIDGLEYRELEKKFSYLRVTDVHKCFFHIYTHSVTWAIKGKGYSKTYSDTYSFESRFDRLMQRSNYNETNGIVIGPEISRIFAEIIFQAIDKGTIDRLPGKIHNQDYAIRRYVDDYFIFASTEQTLDEITEVLREHLQLYKLFINGEKTKTSTRPFVSNLTLAKSELSSLVSDLNGCIDGLAGADAVKVRKELKKVNRLAENIRLISQRYEVSFSSLSGQLFSALTGLIKRSINALASATDENIIPAVTQMAATLLRIVFHIAALDARVRPSYRICEIAIAVNALSASSQQDAFDQLIHLVKDELDGLIRALLRRQLVGFEDSVEIYNFLITGAQYCGEGFLEAKGPKDALRQIREMKELSYFGFVTAKFCYLKNQTKYRDELKEINAKARARLDASIVEVPTFAQIYLLACDYLSSPDINPSEKRTLVEAICGGQPSNADVVEAGKYLNFVDWRGVRIMHMLERRRLRPVYSWS